MKIVHVIGDIDPAKGGTQAVVMRLAAAQAALGHEVSIASYSDAAINQRLRTVTDAIPGYAAVAQHFLPKPSLVETLFAGQARQMLRPLLREADFLHLHGVWEMILPCAASLARKRNVPYCIHTAGMLDVWSIQQSTWKKKIALRAGFRKMLDKAAFIHTLNNDEALLMRPLGLKPPCIVVPNGIFMEEIEDGGEAGQFRRSVPDLADRDFVLFLSRLHYKKGLDILADAFAQIAREFPQIDLVVAGPDGGAEESFDRAIAAHGLSCRVHRVGGVYGSLKIAAMREATCFCLPSRQEGFSVAITEALACALPVVITDACHFPEVASSRSGMVQTVDATSIADGLRQILADRPEAVAMGLRGRNLVYSNYTWPQIARRMVDCYMENGASKPARNLADMGAVFPSAI